MKTKVNVWFGNGQVFLANERKVHFLGDEINFSMERVDSKYSGRDWKLTHEVVVSVGTYLEPIKAIAALRNILDEMERRAGVQSKDTVRSNEQPRLKGSAAHKNADSRQERRIIQL